MGTMRHDGNGEWFLSEAKTVVKDQVDTILRRAGEYGQVDPRMERDRKLWTVLVLTGWRISEGLHLEKSDILRDRVWLIRRKKKHLAPTQVDVNPEGMKILHELADSVESGWLFPGKSGPCFIERRPSFEAEKCPDCSKTVAPLSMVKKRADRVSHFLHHLTNEHGRTAEWVEAWIQSASIQRSEQFCVGGHVNIRHIQARWMALLKELDLYQRGRGVHTLRHTAITDICNVSQNPALAMKFAGHSSVDMTMKYFHATKMKETLGKMPSYGTPSAKE